jgi:8-oxo-dGTP pyrophosphatase MutT (NUDIX family)
MPVAFGQDGVGRVLLLTSRETKRWVIPKGWPMKGRKPWEAAAQEALEEAGLIGQVSKNRWGTIHTLSDAQLTLICAMSMFFF